MDEVKPKFSCPSFEHAANLPHFLGLGIKANFCFSPPLNRREEKEEKKEREEWEGRKGGGKERGEPQEEGKKEKTVVR